MAAVTQAGLDEVAHLAEATTAAGYKGGYDILDGGRPLSRTCVGSRGVRGRARGR